MTVTVLWCSTHLPIITNTNWLDVIVVFLWHLHCFSSPSSFRMHGPEPLINNMQWLDKDHLKIKEWRRRDVIIQRWNRFITTIYDWTWTQLTGCISQQWCNFPSLYSTVEGLASIADHCGCWSQQHLTYCIKTLSKTVVFSHLV